MSLVLVLDCGATNLRAIAVDPKGEIVASQYLQNETVIGVTGIDHHIWDFEQIWQKLCRCAKSVIAEVGAKNIAALTVTTFGVDGAPFNENEQQIYPIISWKCPRTINTMKQVEKDIDRASLYQMNGIGDYSFNTLYKLKWLKDNEPEVFSKMDKFVFISSMITHRLTGKMTTDYTMAGTSMLTQLDSCDWNEQILSYLGLTSGDFPPLVMAGDVIGNTIPQVNANFGLDSSIPVVSAGHDTQFALIGSGAEKDQAFLSSGTWEILMARSQRPSLDSQALTRGVTVELDSQAGVFNPATQWLSSAVVEWAADKFYSVEKRNGDLYSVMIDEARMAGCGAGGVRFNVDLTAVESGEAQGSIEGLSIHTSRGQIMRAVFEGLSETLKERFDYLNMLCPLQDGPVVVVGGGTKNKLWNQLRANALQRPLHIVKQAEATVIGAAMYGFVGAGHYPNLDAAQLKMKPELTAVYPE